MIREFKDIGGYILDSSTGKSIDEFLKALTISPNEPYKDEDIKFYYEIVFNLDVNSNNIEIKTGNELFASNRYKFFGFKLPAARNSKIYFTTNNYESHLLTIPHLIKYLQGKNFVSDGFLNLLNNLNETFYDGANNSDYCLKYENFIEVQKIKILDYSIEKIKELPKSIFNSEKIDDNDAAELNKYYKKGEKTYTLQKEIDTSNYKKIVSILRKVESKKYSFNEIQKKAIEKFIYIDVLKTQKKYWEYLRRGLNIYSLKINDEYIHETQPYKQDYLKLVYYSLKERFFEKNIDTICSICGSNENRVTGKIDIPTKFYITDKPYFFENLSPDNAYKSFSICEVCYEKVRIGINYIHENLYSRLFRSLNYYIIPKNAEDLFDKKKLIEKKIMAWLGASKTTSEDIKNLEKILKIEKKYENFQIDFLFWFVPERQAAAFIVLDNITDVSYKRLNYVINSLDDINSEDFYDDMKYKPNINDLYFFLFPNKYSHEKIDNKLYRKELISLFSSLLKGRTIDYQYLILNFNYIFRKTFYKKKTSKEQQNYILDYRPTKMNILLTWINNIANSQGGFNNMEGKSAIEIENKDVLEFFNIHKDIYENSPYRQGLFLLGKLINSIKSKQKNKNITILNKINFDGIPVRRVKKFILDVTESLKFYDLFEQENKTYSEMMDRLQGIENSSLSKDEVVFYILSGISFGRYILSKYAKINKIKGEQTNE